MVLSWSKLTFDYTKLKLQEQGSLLNGPNPLKMAQNWTQNKVFYLSAA